MERGEGVGERRGRWREWREMERGEEEGGRRG